MNPVRLSFALRSVADRIDRSLRPSRSAVAAELRRVLAAMDEKTISLDASSDIGYSDSNPVDDDEDGVGHEIEVALKAAGATSVKWTDEGVDVSFPSGSEDGVRKAIEEVRGGSFGPDFGSYFSAMMELDEDGNPVSHSQPSGSTKIKINKVTFVPEEEGNEPGMPTFRVDGTWKGEMFEYDVSVELDGRDADWELVSGSDPNDPDDDEDWEEWMNDGTTAVYDAIYESDDYKRLTALPDMPSE